MKTSHSFVVRLAASLRWSALAFSVCALVLPGGADVLRVRADSWMPMNGDPANEKPGYVVEILKAVCEKSGLTLDYQLLPWEESLAAVRGGAIDAVIGAGASEAAGLVLPSEPIGTARISLWVRKGSPWKFSGVDSLPGQRLGVNPGYDYWKELDAYIEGASESQVVTFSSEDPLAEMIQKLHDSAIDVVPETEAVFVWNARALGLDPEEFRAEHTNSGEAIYVAFTAGAQGRHYAELFDATLTELRESGELKKILERYGIKRF